MSQFKGAILNQYWSKMEKLCLPYCSFVAPPHVGVFKSETPGIFHPLIEISLLFVVSLCQIEQFAS